VQNVTASAVLPAAGFTRNGRGPPGTILEFSHLYDASRSDAEGEFQSHCQELIQKETEERYIEVSG
jgi:hypothetical protein